ncbi:helix-turn-helix transcriptional regulator [Leucobacter massiliensis]|uniref:DNA-binding transcriptional regulator n=1 Tax=Leucobacter massiliensis TaxID=1686285 RepID=A0A2S9QRP9_9MICO|nr:WYL domain-containing protein [Leucobacter massiliensis]PRI12266.1 DNA-binding transcriptional regulator [Leucobacter massiliensis]
MHKNVIAPDRVLLLLSLVPYLREHGPTPVAELAAAFGVPAELLRGLVRFLGTAGVPGETLSYQHEDLFDIDWDALERDDVVSLTQTVAVDEAPRFAQTETAALIAGLHALTPVLPPDDAALAQRTAARLGSALGGLGPQPISVTADAEDERVAAVVAAIAAERVLAFDYRDAEGAVTSRRAEPIQLSQESGAWYLRAYCLDRAAERTFRVEQMSSIRQLGEAATHREAPGEARRAITEIVALVGAGALDRIAGFSPEPIGAEGERVRVRVEAWHPGTAVRLVQQAPGEVVVEAPASAREAVRSWAEAGLAAAEAGPGAAEPGSGGAAAHPRETESHSPPGIH